MTGPAYPDDQFGAELILDLTGCAPDRINSADAIADYTAKLCARIGMTAYGDPWIRHFGHARPLTSGYTLIQPIEESAIVAHFSPATGKACLNTFSCSPFDAHATAEYTRDFFGGTILRRHLLDRG